MTLTHRWVIAGFSTLFYLNSLGNFFVWNDWTLIVENFLMKDSRNLPEIFTAALKISPCSRALNENLRAVLKKRQA